MSGHSKWSKIKRKKAANDLKNSKVMSKMIRELTVAAREGGGDVDANPRLRTAVANARAVNMTNDVIERAIRRGTGDLPGTSYERCVYEGYGPSGVAILIEVTTDNRNRSAADVRHVLTKHGGSLGAPNSVAWMFDKQGSILVRKEGTNEEELMLAALDAGAEDVQDDEDLYEIVTTPETFEDVRASLEEQGYVIESANLNMVPQTTVTLEGSDAAQLLKLLDAIEDLEDVSNVYANFEIDDELMRQLDMDAA